MFKSDLGRGPGRGHRISTGPASLFTAAISTGVFGGFPGLQSRSFRYLGYLLGTLFFNVI